MVFTHLPANVFLIAAAFMPTVEWAVALLLLRYAISSMDVPARNSYVMAVVPPHERAAAASFTAVPRSLAAGISPVFAGWMLGVSSFGFSTLVTIQDATAAERVEMVEALARKLVSHLGAPSLEAARPAAEEEVMLAESLCGGHAVNTLVALHRSLEKGAIREQFRTLKPRDETAFSASHLAGHDRAFQFFEEEVEDHVDLFEIRGTD
jgi:hypothetical protein